MSKLSDFFPDIDLEITYDLSSGVFSKSDIQTDVQGILSSSLAAQQSVADMQKGQSRFSQVSEIVVSDNISKFGPIPSNSIEATYKVGSTVYVYASPSYKAIDPAGREITVGQNIFHAIAHHTHNKDETSKTGEKIAVERENQIFNPLGYPTMKYGEIKPVARIPGEKPAYFVSTLPYTDPITFSDLMPSDFRDSDPFGGYISDKENEMWMAETNRDQSPFGGGISDQDLADLYSDKASPNPTDSAISSTSIMGDLPDGGAPSISEADITDALADFAEAISNMSVDQIEDEWNAGALGTPSSAPSSFGISPGVDPGSLMGNTGRDTLGPSPSSFTSPTQNQSHAAAIDVAAKSASPEVYSPDLGAAYRTDNPSSPTYGKAPTNESFTPGNAPSPNDLYGRSAPGSSAAKNTPGSKQDMADIYSYWNIGTPDDMIDVDQDDFAGAMGLGWEDAFSAGPEAGEQSSNGSNQGSIGGSKNDEGIDFGVDHESDISADMSGGVYGGKADQSSQPDASSTGGGSSGGSNGSKGDPSDPMDAAYYGPDGLANFGNGYVNVWEKDQAMAKDAKDKDQEQKPAEVEVGDGDGGGGGSWVICTELNAQDLLEDELYRLTSSHSLNALSQVTLEGYWFWAVPYVRLMKRSKIATAIAQPIAVGRARQIAHQLKPAKYPKGSFFGKLTQFVGVPVCTLIGKGMQALAKIIELHNDVVMNNPSGQTTGNQ